MRAYTIFLLLTLLVGFSSLTGATVQVEGEAHQNSYTLILKAHVFDDINKALLQDQNVLIEGNRIKAVGGDIPAPEGATIIDGNGRTLTSSLKRF